jgi:PAS domain S-box-containing protein
MPAAQPLESWFSHSGFMPHIHCYLAKPELVWTMFITDMMIGIAYVAISITLWALIRRIKLPFNVVVACFGLFILACGLTHFMEVWTLWHPIYWWSAAVKAVTAIASVGTGIYLYQLRHSIFTVAEAAKLSEQRRLDLEALTKSLEQRVNERTAALEHANAMLRDEKRLREEALIQDIADRKRADDALRESEVRFRLLANSIPQIAWMTNFQGVLEYVNDQWVEYTGRSLEQVRGDGGISAVHPDDQASVAENWTQALRESSEFEIEFRLLNARTKEFEWFLSRGVPVKNSLEKVERWFGTNTNIQELRKTRGALEDALRSRDEFLSIASHELKTPMTSLKLQLQMARRSIRPAEGVAPSPEKLARVVDVSMHQINRLQALVEDLLDVSRIAAGKLQFSFEQADLTGIVRDTVERHREQLTAAGCPFEFVAGDPAPVWCDPFRIEQVVTNLLTNASKYGAGNSVRVSVEHSERIARVIVRDLGPGIPREKQERIFERFERAVDHNRISGLGLGLYISREIVRAHEGTIRVESEPGQGATFVVELPAGPRPVK